jgi:hypothetical protein
MGFLVLTLPFSSLGAQARDKYRYGCGKGYHTKGADPTRCSHPGIIRNPKQSASEEDQTTPSSLIFRNSLSYLHNAFLCWPPTDHDGLLTDGGPSLTPEIAGGMAGPPTATHTHFPKLFVRSFMPPPNDEDKP